ncbi:phosphatidylinositol 5-phosphate 4-kinase type-2 beta isoform X5 [Buteo buteo]|uniref:phosphatidylinositol 5-phosphate 4-kinase type-2 beta isoform X5 n=1 Tax=Buteo buteo TaxID=30397 RepID=UPI003EB8EA82
MDKILFDTVTISSVGLEGGVRRVCKISVARYLVAHRFEWCLTQRKLLRRERKSEQSIADTADISLGFCNINELSNVPVPVMLMPDDFKAYSKIKVDNHLFNKENLPSRFKFKEYCPLVFRNLRERFGIDDQDYQNSVTRSAPVNSDSQGRCGARFLTTYDRRFVIKAVSSEDVAEMHNILKKYHQFIVECHGNTLLPQFLGMYRLTVDGVETYMVVTRNVFSHRLTVHRKYDLKGSTVSREASDKEKVWTIPGQPFLPPGGWKQAVPSNCSGRDGTDLVVPCPALLCYVDTTRNGGNFLGDNPPSIKTHISAMVSLWKDFFIVLPAYQTESGQQLAFATDAFINQTSSSQILGISQHVCKFLVSGAIRETYD